MKRYFALLGILLALACTPESKPGLPISFSTKEINLDSDGSPVTVTVVTDGARWTVTPSYPWLIVSPDSGSGEMVITVSAEENPRDEEREATLDFSMPSAFNGIISLVVTQAAGEAEEGGEGGEGGGQGGEGGEGGEGGGHGGGDTPHQVSGLQYLGCYEIPAIDLLDKEKCNDSDKEEYGNTKWYNYKTVNEDQMVVTHTFSRDNKLYRNYTALVDKNHQVALWAAFPMHSDAYPHKVDRHNAWTNDPGIPDEWQQAVASGNYDKGHMVASNYRRACMDSQNQTFYYINQAPQYKRFNNGLWNTMEQAVQGNSPKGSDTLYVVVGLLWEYGVGAEVTEDYCGDYLVPSHYYTLLMRCAFDDSGTVTKAKGCAYLYKNRDYGNITYSDGLNTIDEIERRTGFDFFANVPKSLQDAAETQRASVWTW